MPRLSLQLRETERNPMLRGSQSCLRTRGPAWAGPTSPRSIRMAPGRRHSGFVRDVKGFAKAEEVAGITKAVAEVATNSNPAAGDNDTEELLEVAPEELTRAEGWDWNRSTSLKRQEERKLRKETNPQGAAQGGLGRSSCRPQRAPKTFADTDPSTERLSLGERALHAALSAHKPAYDGKKKHTKRTTRNMCQKTANPQEEPQAGAPGGYSSRRPCYQRRWQPRAC